VIQTTRWSPDTCSCVIEYQWDDSVDSTLRVHTASKTIAQCPQHAGQNLATHFGSLIEENPRKNKIIDKILTQFPALTADDITWSFDSNRLLTVTIAKLTTVQKAALQTAANNLVGAGKVLVL
jgi:hypothetical protein